MAFALCEEPVMEMGDGRRERDGDETENGRRMCLVRLFYHRFPLPPLRTWVRRK